MSPQDIVHQYNLNHLVVAYGYIYMDIRNIIKGLKQAGRLASNHLTKNLTINGYILVPHTPYFWRHHTSDLVFSLVVDNFVIK